MSLWLPSMHQELIYLGAVLSTAKGIIIKHASQPQTKTERTPLLWSLAITVWATQKLRCYLIGTHFDIKMDHEPYYSQPCTLTEIGKMALQLRGFEN